MKNEETTNYFLLMMLIDVVLHKWFVNKFLHADANLVVMNVGLLTYSRGEFFMDLC